MFEELNWTISCAQRMQCNVFISSIFRERHERYIRTTGEQYVKSAGVYIETHDVYTRISNASYAGLSLCNDLSCYPVESLRTTRRSTRGNPRPHECAYLPRSTTSQKLLISWFLITYSRWRTEVKRERNWALFVIENGRTGISRVSHHFCFLLSINFA